MNDRDRRSTAPLMHVLVAALLAGAAIVAAVPTTAQANQRNAASDEPVTVRAQFVPVTPHRAVDTRTDLGPVQAGEVRTAMLGGAPRRAVAVMATLTAVSPTADTFLTAWRAGDPQPGTSNLVAERSAIVSVPAIVGLNGDAQIAITTGAGSVDVLVDVTGWFVEGAPEQGTRYLPLPPNRVVDTRASYPIGPGDAVTLSLTRRAPYQDVQALALNLTATGGTTEGYLAAVPWGGEVPWVTSLSYRGGAPRAATAVAVLGRDGQVGVVNGSDGWVHEVVDLHGVFVTASSSTGGRFVPVAPVRLADTRAVTPLQAGAPLRITVDDQAGADAAGAVVVVVTVVGGTEPAEISARAAGTSDAPLGQLPVPVSSAATNMLTVPVTDGSFELLVSNGSADVVVDVLGWYEPLLAAASADDA